MIVVSTHVTFVTKGAEHATVTNVLLHRIEVSGSVNAEPPLPNVIWHGPARSAMQPTTVSVSVQISEPAEPDGIGGVDEHVSPSLAPASADSCASSKLRASALDIRASALEMRASGPFEPNVGFDDDEHAENNTAARSGLTRP